MNLIKTAWLTTTALAALLPMQPSLAADLPVKARPVVAAGFDWSGVYIGVHAGYGGGMKDWSPEGTQADFVARGALDGLHHVGDGGQSSRPTSPHARSPAGA